MDSLSPRLSLYAFAGLVLLLGLASPALADDTLYMTGDSLTLAAPTATQAQSMPFNGRAYVGEPGGGELRWSYKMTNAASILPGDATFYVEVTDTVVMPPNGGAGIGSSGVNICPFYMEIYANDVGWYYCSYAHAGSVLPPGVYPITIEWTSLESLEALDVAAGDTLHVWLTTDAVTREQRPAMQFLWGANGTASHIALLGSNERSVAPPQDPGDGDPTGTETEPSPGPTTTTDPSGQPDATSGSKPAPVDGTAVAGLVIALAAVVGRVRRAA